MARPSVPLPSLRSFFAPPSPALWVQLAAIGIPTGLTLWLYWLGAAPGLTWAHNGVDGGDLLAAAVTNGVPHPSGYPLYTLLLRGWLWLGHQINPQLETAYWGNRLSALCVAGAIAFTVTATAALLRSHPLRWLWAMMAALSFAVTPLAWSQALITEVYAFHALLIAAMGWAVLCQRIPAVGIGVLMGLGAAHHLTSLLLWPALLYWRISSPGNAAILGGFEVASRDAGVPRMQQAGWGMAAWMVSVALLVALPFYGWIVWRVATADQPLPIAWGYPRDLSGLWWLVSGAAYRAYLFGMTPLEYGGRLAALARLLVEQFTPLGLALVIGGFAVWDRQHPFLRNGALLWSLPISLYAAGYNTVDSYIYLLPVVWLMSLMVGQGLASGSEWLARRFLYAPYLFIILAIIGIVALTLWRLPQLDLRNDHAAQDFLNAAATTLETGSLVISSADAPTFTLWYGEWGSHINGSGRLAQVVPDLVFVNHALYQFGWYRNLMHDLYPEVPMMGASFAELVEANRSLRPIYFTEPPNEIAQDEIFQGEISPAEVTPVGIFWRLN